MPIWHVLVCDTWCHIEHDDAALPIDIISVTKTSKLFLSCGIPDIELDLTQVLLTSIRNESSGLKSGGTYRRETKRVNLYSERSDVLFLKLSSQMALNECCLLPYDISLIVAWWTKTIALSKSYLSCTTITNKHKLKGWNWLSFSHGCVWSSFGCEAMACDRMIVSKDSYGGGVALWSSNMEQNH